MTESRKLVFHETARIALGETICVAVMYAAYAMLGRISLSVVLGGIVGGLFAVGNFFFMAVAASLAADKAETGDPERGKKLLKGFYPIRLLVLAGLLIVFAKSGAFDVLALVLPLLFVRLTVTMTAFFKKGR